MKKLLFITLALFIIAPNAFAMPLNANNMTLTDLQGVFNGIGSTIDANSDESGAEKFAFQSTGATAHYVANIGTPAANIEFGFYDLSDSNKQLTIFDGSRNVGDNTQIYIDYNNSELTSYYMTGSGPNIQTVTVDNIQMSLPSLGFYIKSGSMTYFSVSDQNTGGTADLDGDGVVDNDHFLVYEGKSDVVNLPGIQQGLNDYAHWYVAMEASEIDGIDDNFTDMVVHLESIQPVPEPATFLLLGIGILGFCGLLRKK
ncbi:MAG: hypothetical protein CSA29_01740 [Desulfobacterales bacterium]|nr:MAG: hypothetical protein CSA29_01740 [Desulfobacterales bacterium]